MELSSHNAAPAAELADGWEVRSLGRIGPLQRGFDLPNSIRSDGPYPVVYSNGIINSHAKAMVRGPGVVTGRSGTLGKVHFVESDYWPHNTSLWVTNFNGFNPLFIYYLYTHIGFERFAAGSGVPTLNRNDAHSFDVAVPIDPAEQSAIATALSDVDALLATQDALIAKKRAIKQGAMQELLTGKRRLPGFSGEWEECVLGDVVRIRNEKISTRSVDAEMLCIELENIGQGSGRLESRSTAGSAVSTKYTFKTGDVLFGRLRSYLRKYWLATESGLCTTEIWPLVVNDERLLPGYLFAVVQTDAFIEAASIAFGTHMPRADWGVIRNFDVQLPSVKEQEAIVEMLNDMDGHIAALEAQRAKTAQLKQGMMQALLTGRIRLV